ncbi:MAG: WD40 repeat domain-containing protein [Anaerolineae bacterium]
MFQLSKLKSLRLAPDWRPQWKALIGWGASLGMILMLTAAFQCQVFPTDTAKNPGVVRALPLSHSELEGITSGFIEPTSRGSASLQPAISEDGIDVKQLASWGKDTGYAVAFAPDGKLLAVGSSVGIYLYDTRDLSETNLIVTGVRARGLAFSPDGAILAGGLFDDSVRLWRVADGQLLQTLKGHTNWVRDVAISPDGAYLASASDDDTLRLWRLSDGTLLRTIQVGTKGVRCVAFSPDGKVLASGDRIGAVHVWRVADGKLVQTLLGHTEWVRTVAFSPDGKLLASGSFDKTARIWQLANGELLHTLKGHTESVLSVAFSPDGATLATGSADKTIGLWRITDGASVGRLTGHDGFVFDVAFSPEETLLASGAEDNTIRIWNVSGEEKTQQAQGQASEPGEGTAFTTSDCRFCHHPKSATQPSFIVQVRCETCHPEGASLNWCPAIPRSSGIRGLPHNLAIEPSGKGAPGNRKDIGLIIATPGNGEVLYSPNDTHSVAFVKGIVFYDGDPSETQVQLDLLSGSNRVATLTTSPQQDGTFSFLLGLSPNGGVPVSQTNVANDILTCLSCHSTTVEAYLPPGRVRLVANATTPEGLQAQDERWVVVEQSGQAMAPVKVVDENKGEPIPGLPVQAITVLYDWRGRQFSATTDTQGEAKLEIEALTETSTPYLVNVPSTVLDGMFYSSRRPAQLLLPAGAGSAISVTLTVRAQLGQIQGGLEPEGGGTVSSAPVWAVRLPDGAAHRTQATSTGHFTFSHLPIADYLVIPDPDATAARGWI